MWVYLFNKEGDVLWRVEGKLSEEKGRSLRDYLSQN